MSAIRLTRALLRGATLRRIRTLGAACWVAGCANLIGLDDYTESDEPVRPANGGDAGAAGATQAGAPGGSDEDTGGRPATTGGRPPQTGGAPANTGGSANTGGARPPTGGRTATGGARSSGGVAPVAGAPATSGAGGGGPVTSCALPAYEGACASCIDASCGSACDPCLGDPDCRALLACAQGCFSGACLEGCFDAHPDSTDALVAVYDTCAYTTCAASCGARFGASCDLDEECATGTCSGPEGFCTYLCDDDLDCPIDGWCAQDVDGITRCLPECIDSDCPAGHHCGYVSTLDDYALPLCTSLQALSEPCFSDAECHSFWCTGSPGSQGWCTTPCLDNLSCATDSSCAADSFGDPLCLLTCEGPATCNPYPASECSATFDIEDNDVDVCWL